MSGQLRTLRNRIRSVENTKKITRAMEMVAAAKLRKFQDMMAKSRAYTEGLESLLKRLSGGPFAQQHPFINPEKRFESSEEASEKKDKPERAALILMASDAGLCGSYNNDLVTMGTQFVKKSSQVPVVISVGKYGATALKSAGIGCANTFADIRASRVEEILAELKTVVQRVYLSGEVDSIYVVYSHFKTLTSFKAITEKILPLEPPKAEENLPAGQAGAQDVSKDYIFEPSPEAVFKKLVPQFFEAKMRMVFLEAIVSEQIARMTAMNQATKNAKEMIDSLVLKRNKARQAAITKELIEIVSGSQALKLK